MTQYLMIRPCAFGYNPQTAVNNAFQKDGPQEGVQEKALAEFDAYVALLRARDVSVVVVEDTPLPPTPDAIFPNNWISFHPGQMAVLYPMFAPNRRLERKKTVFQAIQAQSPRIRWVDMSLRERQNRFLEGTGSLVFDRKNERAYACLSPRTDRELVHDLCQTLNYKPLCFHALGAPDAAGERQQIYHTNVMMCVADSYVVICPDALPIADEKEQLWAQFQEDHKEIIAISLDQMNHFAGNMFQVFSTDGTPYLVMSRQAYLWLTPSQRDKLASFNALITPSLDTIETNGGGSARCMLAEVV